MKRVIFGLLFELIFRFVSGGIQSFTQRYADYHERKGRGFRKEPGMASSVSGRPQWELTPFSFKADWYENSGAQIPRPRMDSTKRGANPSSHEDVLARITLEELKQWVSLPAGRALLAQALREYYAAGGSTPASPTSSIPRERVNGDKGSYNHG